MGGRVSQQDDCAVGDNAGVGGAIGVGKVLGFMVVLRFGFGADFSVLDYG